MERPLLTRRLSATEFARWYWLKTELVAFRRELRISGAGSKPEINARIGASLAGASAFARTSRRAHAQMPLTFRTEALIGAGWSCKPALGAFFRAQCGKTFRFNAAVRALHSHRRSNCVVHSTLLNTRWLCEADACRAVRVCDAALCAASADRFVRWSTNGTSAEGFRDWTGAVPVCDPCSHDGVSTL